MALLPLALMLGACAPATSTFGVKIPTPSTATSMVIVRKAQDTAPRYPFKAGQGWTVVGYNQNGNKLKSKITLIDDEPTYRTSSNGRGVWIYDADNGYIVLYKLERGRGTGEQRAVPRPRASSPGPRPLRYASRTPVTQ
ncbi:hypothetical protein [Deinococcus arenicola]|nr:hypothetical protein [Deinococcus sp. ZS9-10]